MKQAHILLVEDTEENIDVLIETLRDEFTISVAVNGKIALEKVKEKHPDIILLDIQMPVMDGYETCQKLKEDPETSKIPVMFLTALTEEGNESKGLALGAVDYIFKPFSPSIVKARVRNQVELKRYKDQLEDIVQERTQKLKEAHEKLRLIDATKNDFLGAISHELRTPVNGVLGVAQIALDYIENEAMKVELTKLFELGNNRLLETIDSALLLAKLQSSDEEMELEEVDLSLVIDEEVEKVLPQFLEKQLQVDSDVIRDWHVVGNGQILAQVFDTLLRILLLMGAQGSIVRVSMVDSGQRRGVILDVEGQQFSQELIDTIFEPFSYERASSYISELGLRPPLVQKMTKLFGGSLTVGNLEESGIWIKLLLPYEDY